MASVNERRCGAQPAYGEDLLRAVQVELPVHHVNIIKEKVCPQAAQTASAWAATRSPLHYHAADAEDRWLQREYFSSVECYGKVDGLAGSKQGEKDSVPRQSL